MQGDCFLNGSHGFEFYGGIGYQPDRSVEGFGDGSVSL